MRTYEDVKNDIMLGCDPESAFREARIDTETAIEMMEHVIYREAQEVAVREFVRDCDAFESRARAAGYKLTKCAPLATWYLDAGATVDRRAILSLIIGLRPHLPPGYRLIVAMTVWADVAGVHIRKHDLDD